MTTYSAQDRLAAIQKAGFANPLTALGISLAEFGVNREVTAQAQSDNYFQPGANPDYPQGGREESYGPWQIHLLAHPDVTKSCAMDLQCSTAAAYKISNGGTNYNPWSTFTNGAYKTALADIEKTLALPSTSTSSPSASGSSPDAGPSDGASAGSAPAEPCNLSSQQKGSAISLAGGGLNYQEIADRIGAEPRCIAELFGAELPNLPTQAGDAIAKAVPDLGGLTKFTDLLKSENLWRIGFVIVGAFAVFAGGRMYLANSEEAPVPEAVK